MRRAIVDIEKRVYEKLSKTVQKIEKLETGQKKLTQKIATVNTQVTQVENKTQIRYSNPHVRGRSQSGTARNERTT